MARLSGSDDSRLALDAPVNESAAARARLYALFAEALSFPTAEFLTRLSEGSWWEEFRSASGQQPHDPAEAAPGLQSIESSWDLSTLARDYSGLFDVGSGRPRISLLARRYVDTPEQALWQELLAFYAHFGLDFARGYAAEQPDHLLTELAFMHYLCFLEAASDSDNAGLTRGQADFLERHLVPLCGGVGDRLPAIELPAPYGFCLAELVRFVARDMAALAAAGRN